MIKYLKTCNSPKDSTSFLGPLILPPAGNKRPWEQGWIFNTPLILPLVPGGGEMRDPGKEVVKDNLFHTFKCLKAYTDFRGQFWKMNKITCYKNRWRNIQMYSFTSLTLIVHVLAANYWRQCSRQSINYTLSCLCFIPKAMHQVDMDEFWWKQISLPQNT